MLCGRVRLFARESVVFLLPVLCEWSWSGPAASGWLRLWLEKKIAHSRRGPGRSQLPPGARMTALSSRRARLFATSSSRGAVGLSFVRPAMLTAGAISLTAGGGQCSPPCHPQVWRRRGADDHVPRGDTPHAYDTRRASLHALVRRTSRGLRVDRALEDYNHCCRLCYQGWA